MSFKLRITWCCKIWIKKLCKNQSQWFFLLFIKNINELSDAVSGTEKKVSAKLIGLNSREWFEKL